MPTYYDIFSNIMVGNLSSKKYGVAVGLCAFFGMLGIHHFYIGNILHGIFDFLLLIIGSVLLFTPEYGGLGVLLLVIDFIHTAVVFFRLITENQKDGYGKIIAFQVYKNPDLE